MNPIDIASALVSPRAIAAALPAALSILDERLYDARAEEARLRDAWALAIRNGDEIQHTLADDYFAKADEVAELTDLRRRVEEKLHDL